MRKRLAICKKYTTEFWRRSSKGRRAEDIPMVQRAVFHEDIQGETLLDIRQTLGYSAPQLSPETEAPAEAGAWPGDVEVPGGQLRAGGGAGRLVRLRPRKMGASRRGRSISDCPRAGHAKRIRGLRGARRLLPARTLVGRRLALAQATDARHPIYWRRASGGGWTRRHFDQWLALRPHQPMLHVSWYEAEAYCQWVGRRLPSEVEWEAAASWEPEGRKRRFPWGDSPPEAAHALLDCRHLGCADVAACPAGDSAFGCRQMIGNVWEWTASDFLPYPGFTPDPDHSPASFGSHKVLRGGGWATRSPG